MSTNKKFNSYQNTFHELKNLLFWLENQELTKLENLINIILKKILKGGKIIFCGNGGSAADSQHFAAEFIGRFKFKRDPIEALSLTVDTSIITSISNDFSFDQVFSRQLLAVGKKNDILIALSTSGNSENIIQALKVAKQNKILSVALLGNNGGRSIKFSDYSITVPSKNTARIQEIHTIIGHIICEKIESKILNK